MSKLSNYKFLNRIGEGCFGEVYLVQKINTNEQYVAKKIDLILINREDGAKYLKSEETILRQLNHKNIVRLYDYFEEKDFAYFIMEYCNGGSLAQCLETYKNKYGNPFTQKLIQVFAKQIVEGLNHIHSKGIIHRDLKLDNILLNFKHNDFYNYKDAEIKIIDFGLSTMGIGYSFVGSPNYMDPKILEKFNKAGGIDKLNKYDQKADIWSLGAICYEMLTGQNLFKADDLPDLIKKAEKGIYFLPLSYNLSSELISFLNAMLQYDPNKRASASELLNYPFLTKNINEFTTFDFSRIAYKIKDGKLEINFIHNDTITGIFNPEIAMKNNTIEINLNQIKKNDKNLKKELNELLDSYYKVRSYFNSNNLTKQEEDAKQKINIIRKMQEDLTIGQSINVNNIPKKIYPEYIYGCSSKERKEIFLLIINSYKQKRQQLSNSDINKLKEIDYMIYNLESAFKDIWTPPPKYKYENQSVLPQFSQLNPKNYQIKFVVKRLDNFKVNYNFNTSIIINPNSTLSQQIQLKPDKNAFNEWIWQINENDWINMYNNNQFILRFDFQQGDKEKNSKLQYKIEKEKLGKPCSFNIPRHINHYQKIIINFLLIFINAGKKSIVEEKNLICEKIYPSYEGISYISKSWKY